MARIASAADPGGEFTMLSELQIVDRIRDLIQTQKLSHLLVLAVEEDGSSFSADNGLSIDEAMELMARFTEWLEHGKRRIV